MPETQFGEAEVLTAAPGVQQLLDALADAILNVPGVVRLEPTLSTSGARLLIRPAKTDGLHLLIRGTDVDVDVNLAISSAHRARTVAHRVRSCVAQTLVDSGYRLGSSKVSVLSISP